MRQRLLSARPSVTRTSRHDPRGAKLESVAAEFALLAQRRARIARQLDLLGRQMAAAQASLDAVQGRMTMLAQRMDGIDPSLRTEAALPPAPPPPVYAAPARAPQYQVVQPYAPRADPAPQQPRLMQVPRGPRLSPRRRPFSPE